MSQHMNQNDRQIICAGLKNGESLRAIARQISKNPSTVSREIRGHRIVWDHKPYGRGHNRCVNRNNCNLRGVCNASCTHRCSACGKCAKDCSLYQEEHCSRLDQPPYTCMSCPELNRCPLEKFRYDPFYAQQEYTQTLSEARTGFNLTSAELRNIDERITPLILQGQSVYHAALVCDDSVTVSSRTIYRLVDRCALKARNIDLPRKCKLKPRSGVKPSKKIDKNCRNGRTYSDFKLYMEQHPDVNPVQMDSVVGGMDTSKVLLTFHFIGDFMPAFLRDNNTARTVQDWIEFLYTGLGHNDFCAFFPVILTDNGSEFSNPAAIETASDGTPRTKVFYCDPQASWQKPHVERCHEMYRRILPSGCSFDDLTQNDMALVASHVNSYARHALGDKAPFETLAFYYGKSRADKLLRLLGQVRIPPDMIILSPALLGR